MRTVHLEVCATVQLRLFHRDGRPRMYPGIHIASWWVSPWIATVCLIHRTKVGALREEARFLIRWPCSYLWYDYRWPSTGELQACLVLGGWICGRIWSAPCESKDQAMLYHPEMSNANPISEAAHAVAPGVGRRCLGDFFGGRQ